MKYGSINNYGAFKKMFIIRLNNLISCFGAFCALAVNFAWLPMVMAVDRLSIFKTRKRKIIFLTIASLLGAIVFLIIGLAISLGELGRVMNEKTPPLELRTDVEPLMKRFDLPPTLKSVRCVWVPVNKGYASFPPAPDNPLLIDAYIDLTAPEWKFLASRIARLEETTTFVMQEEVGRLILPESIVKSSKRTGEEISVLGDGLNATGIARYPSAARVMQAVRIGNALLIEFWLD